MRISPLLFLLVVLGTSILRGGEPAFRTDGGDDKLPWFRLKAGAFPAEGSAHHIGGELIEYDRLQRTGSLRIDRDDTQRRSEWDRTLPFTMLPYGWLMYHGAPAELRHIPIGTHVHGHFYIDAKPNKEVKGPFSLALLLEDDFSYFARKNRLWRVDAVNAEKETITVTGVGLASTDVDAKPTEFVAGASMRVWIGRRIGTLADIVPGQTALINLTVCTLKGPGRCTDIWLDPESRQVATDYQLEVHRRHQRERGLAGWVEAVDNKERIVTMTVFGGIDPSLLQNYAPNESCAAAVAENSLRTYDQGSDRMNGTIVEIVNVPVAPGSSGTQIKFKPNTLLEGFRPQRIIRLFSGKTKVDDLPKEERLYE